MDTRPVRFIDEEVEVGFDRPPVLEKRPGCPDQFVWGERVFRIVEMVKEWHNYRRRGRMASNMREEHARTAARRGSWGVGRDYYRVRTEDGRLFDLYYDRAPKDAYRRKGAWYLFRELADDGPEQEIRNG